MTPAEITATLKDQAEQAGFQLFGTCPAIEPTGFGPLVEWLEAGYAGEMHYFQERQQAYSHPRHVLEGVTGIVMLGMNYQTEPHAPIQAGEARIARYAWGTGDYHDLIHQRLKHLKGEILQRVPGALVRGVVDTAPLLEREFGQLAGIGWSAKNTMLINRNHGSWFLLAALLVDFPLAYDQPFRADHCGSCTACLEACPTDAFVEPHKLDATRCISYLTIEHRSPIPTDLRGDIGDWLFGCDVCQDVCPWNNKGSHSQEPLFQPVAGANPIDARQLFYLDDEQFRSRFRKTPLWRAKRRGLVRNAAIVLGNQPDVENLPALATGLQDSEPLIRGASAWALGRHRQNQAAIELRQRLEIEQDPYVIGECQDALAGSG
ncbi:MAG: tRNA epoxyqueuosine(34) reductase QueG [Mariniblastus sp.]|nr:tRNA epoxyqueuosine(34) reductase QueG [Mariniblastus sp.]